MDDLDTYPKRALIVRDPRDVAVSNYYFYHYNMKLQTKDDPTKSPYRWGQKYCNFKRNVIKIAREWPLHTRQWLAVDGIAIVRYEELLANTVDTLVKLCKDLDLNVARHSIEASVANFTFELMSDGRSRGIADKSAFYRKGVVGDHRNYFGPIDHLCMNAAIPKDLRQRFYDQSVS